MQDPAGTEGPFDKALEPSASDLDHLRLRPLRKRAGRFWDYAEGLLGRWLRLYQLLPGRRRSVPKGAMEPRLIYLDRKLSAEPLQLCQTPVVSCRGASSLPTCGNRCFLAP